MNVFVHCRCAMNLSDDIPRHLNEARMKVIGILEDPSSL